MSDKSPDNKSLIKRVRTVPFVGTFLKIANAYAFSGSFRHAAETAPFALWWKRILRKGLMIALLTAALFSAAWIYGTTVTDAKLTTVILTVLPCLLGFGIGAFALIFVLPTAFLRLLRAKQQRYGFGAEILAADLGYPLIVFATALLVAVLLMFFPPNQWTKFIAGFLLLYSLSMIFELISSIFIAATKIIHDSSKRPSDHHETHQD